MNRGRSLAVALVFATPGWAAAEWSTIASTEAIARAEPARRAAQ